MNRVVLAAEILDHELDDARRQSDAEPGNIILAMRLATAMVKTFGVGTDLACGHVSVKPKSEPNMDGGSSAGDELAELARCVATVGACASKRGRAEANDVSGRRKQLSLPVDT